MLTTLEMTKDLYKANNYQGTTSGTIEKLFIFTTNTLPIFIFVFHNFIFLKF